MGTNLKYLYFSDGESRYESGLYTLTFGMMNETIFERETKLFEAWSKKRVGFSPDGIIDETSYRDSKLKILFLMKEVNSKIGLNLKDHLRNGGRSQTWNNIAKWVFGIRNLNQEIEWTELEKIKTKEQRQELFKSICIINLKKSPGSYTTDNNELRKIAEEDKEFLNKQFQIYFESPTTRPDIIISCGSATSNTFNKKVDIPNKINKKMTSRGVGYYEYEKGQFFIYYSHPEARVQDSLLYYGLIDAIKELTCNRQANLPITTKPSFTAYPPQ